MALRINAQQIGYLFFWFFLGMKLRVFQLNGLNADPLDLALLLVGLGFVLYQITKRFFRTHTNDSSTPKPFDP